jgi:RNA polymerase sigma factor (sigma-70 family)
MESKVREEPSNLRLVPEYAAHEECPAAFELKDVAQLYTDRRRNLLGQAFAMVRDRAVAEDLTQEAFARLVAEVKSGNTIRSAVKWTSTVLRNLALNHIEHTKVVGRVIEPDSQSYIDSVPGALRSAEDTYLAEESKTHLKDGLSQLAPLERECILMFAEGYSFNEIAFKKKLSYGVTVAMVRRSLRRLRKTLPAS